ncbi:MAG: hypothetical protein DRN96_08350 [Thermoproteota archaeon]|nr:MAG: hypothetical protein DRN96_08350 [Candidatus Korarchaeota archaeon]
MTWRKSALALILLTLLQTPAPLAQSRSLEVEIYDKIILDFYPNLTCRARVYYTLGILTPWGAIGWLRQYAKPLKEAAEPLLELYRRQDWAALANATPLDAYPLLLRKWHDPGYLRYRIWLLICAQIMFVGAADPFLLTPFDRIAPGEGGEPSVERGIVLEQDF